jgi:hypothetical protein
MRFLKTPQQEVVMRELLHVDGDTWRVTSDEGAARAVRTIVFHCVSNATRPYRVVEIPEPLLRGRGADALSESDLAELFGRSHTMDYSHDAAANPESHGYGDPPLG